MTDLTRAKAFVNKLPIVQMKPDELAHFGVLGMHWGIRNDASQARESRDNTHARNTRRKLAVGTLGASAAAPKIASAIKAKQAAKAANTSKDHSTTRALLKKKKHELTNDEIDKIINRLQKEQKLSKANPNSIERGKKITLSIIAAAGTGVTVYNLIQSKAGQAAILRGSKVVEAVGLKLAEIIVKSL